MLQSVNHPDRAGSVFVRGCGIAAFVFYLRTLDPPPDEPIVPELIEDVGAWLPIPKTEPLDPAKIAQEGEAALEKQPTPAPRETRGDKNHARRPDKPRTCGPACKKRRQKSAKPASSETASSETADEASASTEQADTDQPSTDQGTDD